MKTADMIPLLFIVIATVVSRQRGLDLPEVVSSPHHAMLPMAVSCLLTPLFMHAACYARWNHLDLSVQPSAVPPKANSFKAV